MSDKQTEAASDDKPSKFGKWLSRIIALLFLLLAIVAAIASLDDEQSNNNPPESSSDQGIRFN